MRETEGKSHKNLNIACHVGSNDDVNKEVINSKPTINHDKWVYPKHIVQFH